MDFSADQDYESKSGNTTGAAWRGQEQQDYGYGGQEFYSQNDQNYQYYEQSGQSYANQQQGNDHSYNQNYEQYDNSYENQQKNYNGQSYDHGYSRSSRVEIRVLY